MKIKKTYIIGIAIGFVILILDAIFLRSQPSLNPTYMLIFRTDKNQLFYFVLAIAAIAASIPFMISLIVERKKQKELESKFLEFTRDLVENVKSGTPISKSIINLKTRNYGELTFYVQKLANQISIGIPLSTALITFAKDTQSPVISRAVTLISEAEKAGGQIETILESVSGSVNQTEELKQERKSSVYNLVVQGYIIFIVFIIIMLVLQFKILPMMPEMGTAATSGLNLGGGSGSSCGKALSKDDFVMPLLILLVIQAIFSGLVIGKISEGNIKDGIRHSFFLLAITLLAKTGSSALFG